MLYDRHRLRVKIIIVLNLNIYFRQTLLDKQVYSFNVLHGLHNDRLWVAYKVTFYSTLSDLASYNNE